MKKALVVDDVALNRDILIDIMCDEFEVIEASNGIEALDQIENHFDEISVILLDLVMPEMDGFAVLEKMEERGWIDHFPVLIITSETSSDIELKCLEHGVADFITKPFNESRVRKRLANAADLYDYKNHLEDKIDAQTLEIKQKNKELADLNDKIIQLLGDIVEARSYESGLHIKRVKLFTRILAEDLRKRYPDCGLTDEDIELIVTASPLHDVGKIMISDAILNKPGKLTDEEFSEMKKHTTYGCEVLERSRDIWPDKYNKVCNDICLCHHEKYDGRGYPKGLKGEDIPLCAQIVSLADIYDALVTERVYKKAFTPEKAFEMIMNGECGAFSDRMMDCFVHCRSQLESDVAGES